MQGASRAALRSEVFRSYARARHPHLPELAGLIIAGDFDTATIPAPAPAPDRTDGRLG